jgi:hypothetical protein
MTQRMHKDLKQMLHPYMFVLKEGVEFPEDCFDLSLMMLHVNCLEVLESPKVSPVIVELQAPPVAITQSSQVAF